MSEERASEHDSVKNWFCAAMNGGPFSTDPVLQVDYISPLPDALRRSLGRPIEASVPVDVPGRVVGVMTRLSCGARSCE